MILPFNGITPVIGGNVFIAPTAVVIGDVVVGDNASIWFNAVIRGDMARIRVGANTNIQDNCTVHTDMDHPALIGSNVTVGHNAMIHGCTLEDGCLVGINAVVLNDAVIGKGALVAAGAVVLEGQRVPAHHLAAGIPARTKRTLPVLADGELPGPTLDYLGLVKGYRSSS